MQVALVFEMEVFIFVKKYMLFTIFKTCYLECLLSHKVKFKIQNVQLYMTSEIFNNWKNHTYLLLKVHATLACLQLQKTICSEVLHGTIMEHLIMD